MMLDKKANSSDFLNEFKMGRKAAETIHIHNASGLHPMAKCNIDIRETPLAVFQAPV